MSRKGNTAVYANITQADAARLRGVLRGQTLNDYVRGLISADLEELGQPPLEKLVYERARGLPPRGKPPTHGTLTGYNYFRCRCDACREAARTYYQKWKAAGACTTL
jgi:hypothetical protein